MKKPILHNLVAWVFPGVVGYVYARGHAPYKEGHRQGYEKAKRDIVRSMVANINTWYSISSSDHGNFEWHQITICPEPEDANA